jgi:hypothetical protein
MMRLTNLFARGGRGRPVHFLHIRKTGGTAISEALNPIAPRFGIVLHAHDTRLSDIPRQARVFFFVRHPISRFVSGFFSRLRRGAPRHNYAWNEGEVRAFGRFQRANDLAEALSTADPEKQVHAREAMRGIRHVNSSYGDWFCGTQELDDRLDDVVLIGLQETMESDFERLKSMLNLPRGLSLPEDEILAHRTPAEFDRGLSPLAQQNLREWYAEDIRFYEHCVHLRGCANNRTREDAL